MTLASPGRLTLALLAAGLPALASAKPARLAVVGVDSPPYLMGLADEISKIAVQAAHKRYQVIGPDEVRKALGEAALGKLEGCGDVPCRAEILQPLGVALALGGTLSQNETSYVVDLWLIDVSGRRPVGHLSRSILIASRRLEKDLGEAVPAMLAGRADESGELVIHVTPAATAVTVDDAPLGGGTDFRRALEPGKHKVVLEADGYLTTERWVQLAPAQVVRLDERLIPTSGRMAEAQAETPSAAKAAAPSGGGGWRVPLATWIAVGVSAAAFGTGLYFGVSAADIDHKAGQTYLNGVDQGLTRVQAVQGQTDAQVGNYLFIGAGVALAAAIVIAVVVPSPSSLAPTPAVSGTGPAALHWSFP
ncbi:MAG: PEGA domain-containing protein [Myxococcales bacterium]